MSRTACVVPWTTIDITPDGVPLMCGQAPVPLSVDGRPARIDRDSLESFWNGPDIVAVREAMSRGEQPDACQACWAHERAGGRSLRHEMNETYGLIAGRDWSIDRLLRRSAENGYRADPPVWFQLQFGNTCNLKCRSCNPVSSSRIAADRVQSAWVTDGRPLPPAIPRSQAWFRNIERVAEMVGGNDEPFMLSLIGGEPFLIDEIWQFLELLAERGWSQRCTVGLASNGTRCRPELERLAPQFHTFACTLSLDGHGRVFEYLRHGSQWADVVRTVSWMQTLPNVDVSVSPTLQNGNVLNMVELLRFVDERNLRLLFNVVSEPARLAPTNLPPRVRRIAAERLRRYLDEECRPLNRGVVQGWVGVLEEAGDHFDPELFREFMTFTNDLDASRGESLRDADPELFALLRASGVRWIEDRRHNVSGGPSRDMEQALGRIHRAISDRDVIYPAFAAVSPDHYFQSALLQLDLVDGRLRKHGWKGLAECTAVADYASHYGRMTRALRAWNPAAAVHACDIDRDAIEFCERELGALPVWTGWQPDRDRLPRDLDFVMCMSLLTHTPLEHWRAALRAWREMLKPGGMAAFTVLTDVLAEEWCEGRMQHYGSYPEDERKAALRALREEGFAFLPLAGMYGSDSYGIAFATPDVVRREVEAAGLELLEADPQNETFGQGLVLARKPGGLVADAADAKTEARVVALYDLRLYASEEAGPAVESGWTRVTASEPARPLPTELGFTDPRVAEVRDAQAALAAEHGIDAFCFLYPWAPNGSAWDAPLRDLLTGGRPDFPFCLMVVNDGGERMTVEAAEQLFVGLLPYLRHERYLRQGGHPLFVFGDAGLLIDPLPTTRRWRALAAQHGLGGLHLCAAEPAPAESPQELGFDSFLERPSAAPDAPYAHVVAAALARSRPSYPLLRGVLCRREPFDPRSAELYELWLRTVMEAARGDAPVFIRSWNEWAEGAYLEPDDRDGRQFLAATRRAVRGPLSGLVLLRKLRNALPATDARTEKLLRELESVVSAHERSREELTTLVEVAFARRDTAPLQRWIPVAAHSLPPSSGAVSIDRFGTADGAALHHGEPVLLNEPDAIVSGWAHAGDCDPAAVDLFLVLSSLSSADQRVIRIAERGARPDVAAARPGYPERCGFYGHVPLEDLPPGTWRVGLVQRTPNGAYYDDAQVLVRRG